MPKHAIFRADASLRIGAGHVMRCLALADSFARNGWQCSFAVAEGTRDTVPQLQRANHRIAVLDAADWDDSSRLADAIGAPCNLLVIDHYGLAAAYEAPCRAWSETIMVIDDLANRRHDCDVLLDAANNNRDRYAGLTPPQCKALLGPSFALLASKFPALREEALQRRGLMPVGRILVAFGSTDLDNFTVPALHAIADMGENAAVDVVLGPAAPHLDAVRNLADAVDFQLHVETDDIAGLMMRADLAVGAAGVTAWERCCLGLPGIAVVAAANQQDTAACLGAHGAATILTRPDAQESFSHAIAALFADPEARAEMARRAAALCDGRGADRVRLAVASQVIASDGAPVTLRPADETDAERMFAWQSDTRTRQFARNPEIPDRESHFRWVAARLGAADCLLNIVEYDGRPAAVVRLDRDTPNCASRPGWEISIYVAPDCYGRGIGGAALALARQLVPEAEFVAEVLPDNAASHALFRKAGYEWRDELYWLAPDDPRLEGSST